MSVNTYQEGNLKSILSALAGQEIPRVISLLTLALFLSVFASYTQAQDEAAAPDENKAVPEQDIPVFEEPETGEPESEQQQTEEPVTEDPVTDDGAPEAGIPEAGASDEPVSNSLESADPEPIEGEVYESPLDQVDIYLDAIDEAEVNNGAYSTDLADLYLGLGQSLLESRELDDAKEAYQQGMQVVRVNYGLNSPEQTTYLFAVADIESIQGNRRAANDIINHAYTINARSFGNKSPEMLSVLNRILGWYAIHRPAEAEINSYDDLERASVITGEMAEIIELDKGLGHPDTTEIYRRQGQIHWQTAKYVLGRGISVEPGVIMATGKPSYSVHVREVSIKEHFREGRKAFTKVAESVSLDKGTSLIEQAEAVAQIGDWNLAFGKKQAAGEAYKRAYRELTELSHSEEMADDYFANPVPVRFMNENLQSHGSDLAEEAEVMVKATLTVTAGGRALNVELIEPPESIPHEHLRILSRGISSMHFRPRLSEGSPAKTSDFIFEVPLLVITGDT